MFSLHTDIAFGNGVGSSTILVLTGISTLAEVENEKNTNEENVRIPDYYIESVTELYNLMTKNMHSK